METVRENDPELSDRTLASLSNTLVVLTPATWVGFPESTQLTLAELQYSIKLVLGENPCPETMIFVLTGPDAGETVSEEDVVAGRDAADE